MPESRYGVKTPWRDSGIGENSSVIRERSYDRLGFIGIELDELRNAKSVAVISSDIGRTTVRFIATDEEIMIARSA